ncbi:NAD-dependent epimerase/dehydratase family protein [Chitinophaga rhizophila]|uniref:NAD-dependent epimerase/dehydratase family protein n=1 Tax=Chitinophaga rhizophila TaxID=2866212 RepID=A0ABS7GJ95_9BACT|nr:NAD-dependent epimerase/dehydratase family protein [Chitinophaga rhizophila]MBW8686849.1 NAD-dependent epimerase/dehydratase family protein [Chitinophaga rhizophila]
MVSTASSLSQSGIYTILGAGGIIARELTSVLLANGKQVRLVSRRAKPSPGVTDVVAADITDPLQTRRAISGSSVVFLCAGLTYDHKVWQEAWPKIIQNVIHACSEGGIPLIFFDNVYMYGLVNGKMTEETPHNPCSKKGEIRALVAGKIMDRVKEGRLTAAIARAADFYGPGASATGVLNMMVIDKLAKGKTANWLGSDLVTHSFTYTPDAAKALFMLASDPSSYNQVWHLPTTNPAPNGKEYIEMVAAALRTRPRYIKLGSFMIKMAGFFDTTVSELYEMRYQTTHPYIFDSTKFEKHFNFTPTSYQDGITATIKSMQS